MKQYDLYGSRTLSVDDLRAALEKTLGESFVAHESDYLGGDYYSAGDLRGERFVIQRNAVGGEDAEEIAEPEFADFPVLLRVNATSRGDELNEKLGLIQGLDFLRRDVV